MDKIIYINIILLLLLLFNINFLLIINIKFVNQ